MQNIPVMDTGDGRVRAEIACLKTPVAKTAAYIVTQADAGTLFTNRGAAGSVTFTLPVPKAGTFFGFQKAVINQNIVITTDVAATKIHNLTQGVTLTNSTATEYGLVWIISDGTAWFVISVSGTWAVT